MHPYRPGNFPRQFPSGRPMMPPISRFPMQQMQQGYQQTRGFGNILTKLLGKGTVPTNFGGYPGTSFFPGSFSPGFNPGAGIGGQLMGGGGSGSGLSGLMGNLTSGGIPEMLNNVQKVMGLAQQFGPMIEQYGPFIKNLPAMFKIMKELNNSDDSAGTENETENETTTEFVNEDAVEPPDFENIKVVEPIKTTVKPSRPKLYI